MQDNDIEGMNKLLLASKEMVCQSCGVIAPTKYVEFYQNIGALIMRFRKSIKGYLCKNCIDEHFWSFTGITLVLGWWGIISFFVTPLILLNNIFYYLGALFLLREKKWPVRSKVTAAENARQAPHRKQAIEKEDTKISIYLLIVIIVGILAIVAAYSWNDIFGYQTSSVNVNQIAGQSTATRIMATNKPKTSTPSSAPSCLYWKSIKEIHVGNHVCVYGRIVKIGGTTKYPVIFRFSEEPGTFLIRGPYRGFSGSRDQCIKAEGVMGKDTTYLYMDTEEIELSDYGGCK